MRTEESGDEGNMVDRGLFCLCTGSGLIAGGTRAGSIFHGETLSGRGIVELSSHLTFKYLHFESGHLCCSRSSIPTIVPVNLQQIIMLKDKTKTYSQETVEENQSTFALEPLRLRTSC